MLHFFEYILVVLLSLLMLLKLLPFWFPSICIVAAQDIFEWCLKPHSTKKKKKNYQSRAHLL